MATEEDGLEELTHGADASIGALPDAYCTVCRLPFADTRVAFLIGGRAPDRRRSPMPHACTIFFVHRACLPSDDNTGDNFTLLVRGMVAGEGRLIIYNLKPEPLRG